MVLEVAPNPDKGNGEMYSAYNHPLICGQLPSSSSSPVRRCRAYPRGKLSQLHILPHLLQHVLPKNTPGYLG